MTTATTNVNTFHIRQKNFIRTKFRKLEIDLAKLKFLFFYFYRDFLRRDAEVRVDDELLRAQRVRLLELGSDKDAHGCQELELALLNFQDAEHSVEVVHGQGEDFRMARLLLRDVEHPVDHNLSHVRLDHRLNRAEVVWRSGLAPASGQYVGQNALVFQQGRICEGFDTSEAVLVIVILVLHEGDIFRTAEVHSGKRRRSKFSAAATSVSSETF